MRRRILTQSVQRHLADGEQIREVVHLWSRHRWMVPYCGISAVALFVVAAMSGVVGFVPRVAVGLAGAVAAATATTNYSILVSTNRGLVLLRSSRIRQYAKGGSEKLPAGTSVERVGGTIVSSDWLVADRMLTVPRRGEQAMHAIAAGLGGASG